MIVRTLYQLLPNGDNLYWVNAISGTLDFAPIAGGGSVNTLCSVGAGEASLAVQDDFIYLARGPESAVYRCPLSGGTMTQYSTQNGWRMETDGTTLFWLGDAQSALGSCSPGASCSAWTQLVSNTESPLTGFTLSGDYAYSASDMILRTRK